MTFTSTPIPSSLGAALMEGVGPEPGPKLGAGAGVLQVPGGRPCPLLGVPCSPQCLCCGLPLQSAHHDANAVTFSASSSVAPWGQGHQLLLHTIVGKPLPLPWALKG